MIVIGFTVKDNLADICKELNFVHESNHRFRSSPDVREIRNILNKIESFFRHLIFYICVAHRFRVPLSHPLLILNSLNQEYRQRNKPSINKFLVQLVISILILGHYQIQNLYRHRLLLNEISLKQLLIYMSEVLKILRMVQQILVEKYHYLFEVRVHAEIHKLNNLDVGFRLN